MPKRRADSESDQLSSVEAADQISRHSRKLAELTRQAAQALGAYEGGNTAVRESNSLKLPVETIIMLYATESALMAALRLYALFDSDERMVSYQGINRSLKRVDVREEVLRRSRSNGLAPDEARALISSFEQTYHSLDWQAHGQLMRLRNIGLAHLTERELQSSISYAALRALGHSACLLCRDLELLARGQNNDAEQWVNRHTSQAYVFWARHVKLLHNVELPTWGGILARGP
jgi:hypothetical protein